MFRLAMCIVILCQFPMASLYGDEGLLAGSVVDRVEDASFSYTALYAEMERYLVVVYGEEELAEGLNDFRYVFAFSRGKSRAEDKERNDYR